MDDSVALVSGGSRGLGLGVVEALLESGRRVATFSRKPSSEIEALAAKHGERLLFLAGDMGDFKGLRALVSKVEKEFGPIGGLVNNAGITHEALLIMQDDEAIHRVIDVDLKGTIFLTREAAKRMAVRRHGRIVNISSIVGIRGFSGVAPYSAAKAGMLGFTRSLARELGRRNITVNAVCPGYMETDLVKDMNQKQLQQIVRRTPMGRPGAVDDVVGAVRFFLSEEARFITGQTLTIDGGLTC
jgi:3-oxoacyl-[acyl-carrier protein] reductase